MQRALAELDAGYARLMRGDGVAPGSVAIRHFADICYIGQGYHLEIAVREDDPQPLAALYRDFLAAHDRVYGYAAEMPAKFVNLRAVHRVAVTPPALQTIAPSGVARASRRRVLIDPAIGFETADIHDRAALAVGQAFAGPAIIEQPDTTTLLPSGWRCRVESGGAPLLQPMVVPRLPWCRPENELSDSSNL